MKYNAPLGKSHHVCLQWELTVMRQVHGRVTDAVKRNHWKGNYDAINAELSSITWTEALASDSVNAKWVKLRNILAELVEKYIPFCNEREYRIKRIH